MKKLLILLVAGISLMSCKLSRTVEIQNNTAIDRKDEMVEISLNDLKLCKHHSYVLRNLQNKEVAYQMVKDENNKEKSIIFQADVNASGTASYNFKVGKPAPVKTVSYARYVPERKDDVAWENDFAAYRMYGPKLAAENPSNGVDYWAKRTTELIVDTFYYNELKLKKSYHTDFGKGLDMYKVGFTLGAGGIAPYVNDSLMVNKQYDSYKIIENGPLRSVFELTYNNIMGGKNYKQVIRVTSDAGNLLNKGEVVIQGNEMKLKLAAGIFLHQVKGNILEGKNWTAYSENAISEFGIPSGRIYTAVLFPENVLYNRLEKNNHIMMTTDNTANQPFTYYFGAGWNKWRFPDEKDWTNALNQFELKLKNPLKVNIK